MVENTEAGIKICGKGYVLWTFADDNGMYRSLKLPCYYIPTSNTRIASIQELLKTYPNETVTMTDRSLRLSGNQDTAPMTIKYSTSSNLPHGRGS